MVLTASWRTRTTPIAPHTVTRIATTVSQPLPDQARHLLLDGGLQTSGDKRHPRPHCFEQMLQQLGSVTEDPRRHGDEDDQQREQGEEAVVGDQGAQPAAAVFAVALDDGVRKRNQPVASLKSIDPVDEGDHRLIVVLRSVAGRPVDRFTK
jgi:hypothetical protein